MRLGVDLGGTKIEIIALDENGEMHYRQRVDTPKGDYAATVGRIVGLVREAESQLGLNVNLSGSLGVGIPGAVSHKTRRIKNANSTWLIGQDLQGDLQRQLQCEVRLANDANCFALSEAVDGAGKGAEVVFGVIIGTGCGGGVVVNGRILNGVNAIGGEWGHNPLPWATADDLQMACYCGLKGCNETFLSGSGLQAHYQNRTGSSKTAKQIVALSEQGNIVAEQLMQDYILWLAKGLASVINLIDPDVIVLGGGMSNIQRLYDDVPKLWGNWVFSDQVNTQLLPPKYGDSSGVRGAAWL
ncbi:ROK family protein [Thiomicrorhabdus sp.]|uniref:ROK family protein n=1 Tax=Thiomicrorhabdus sp. TaxID=2039724 RepID=UPI003562B79F